LFTLAPSTIAVYQGDRFFVQAKFAGARYKNRFGLDVAFGDAIVGEVHRIKAPDALGFAGIEAPLIPVYPIGTHLAEKMHAYSLPRERLNSRMKDLVDIALVAAEPLLEPTPVVLHAADLRTALEATFALRATHPLPAVIAAPPAEWAPRYERDRATEAFEWPWATLGELHGLAATFMNPVLAGEEGIWDPVGSAWG
jgi:hypothetical protein